MNRIVKGVGALVATVVVAAAINTFDYFAVKAYASGQSCQEIERNLERNQQGRNWFTDIGYIGRGHYGGDVARKHILEERCQ